MWNSHRWTTYSSNVHNRMPNANKTGNNERGTSMPAIKQVLFVCLFVFVALRPKSTAMVIAGRSVHLTTLFPGQA